jgi:hypothetical protein
MDVNAIRLMGTGDHDATSAGDQDNHQTGMQGSTCNPTAEGNAMTNDNDDLNKTAKQEAAPTIDDFKRHMTDIANGHQEAMQGMTKRQAGSYVKDIINAATIVFGIYTDVVSPDGVGMHIVKGVREMQVVVASGESDQFVMSAIPCISMEQAIAVSRVWGDGEVKVM